MRFGRNNSSAFHRGRSYKTSRQPLLPSANCLSDPRLALMLFFPCMILFPFPLLLAHLHARAPRTSPPRAAASEAALRFELASSRAECRRLAEALAEQVNLPPPNCQGPSIRLDYEGNFSHSSKWARSRFARPSSCVVNGECERPRGRDCCRRRGAQALAVESLRRELDGAASAAAAAREVERGTAQSEAARADAQARTPARQSECSRLKMAQLKESGRPLAAP
eukprot:4207065-Pleurochrysis_carterae.AAC.1